ncbi:MAG TPA: ABC transporter permease subunit, partial [Candidatus Saccharimonadales bacterium]|nr:ABC transporter permease subunit [Candidatus Saccharimonadales bacterium]
SFKNGQLGKSLGNLSPALQKVVGNTDSFRTVGGYIGQQVFALRIPLLMTILGIVVFNGLTVGEERRGLLETQLSLPISRTKIILQKLAAGLVILAITSVGVFVGIWLTLLFIHEHYSYVTIWREILGAVLIGLDFGLLAFMLGSALGKKGIAVGVSSGLAFLSYLISSLVATVPSLKAVEKASLFHYQAPPIISFFHIVVLAAVGSVFCLLGLLLFLRRDIGT